MAELEKNGNFLLNLCNSLPDSIVVTDSKGKIIHYNKKFVEMFNIPSKIALELKNFVDFLSKKQKNPSEFKKMMEEILSSEKKNQVVVEFENRFFEFSINPYFSEEKKGKLIVIRDITEKKKIEEEIRKSEEKYRNLFNLAVDPIVILDRNGRFIEINKKVEEILGYTKDDLIGKRFTEANVLTKKSVLITYKNFLKRMMGFDIKPYEIEVIKKNGEIIIGEINAAPIRENGKIVGDMVIIRDITFRKQAEEEVRKSKELLEKVFLSLDDVVFILDNKKPPTIIDCNPASPFFQSIHLELLKKLTLVQFTKKKFMF